MPAYFTATPSRRTPPLFSRNPTPGAAPRCPARTATAPPPPAAACSGQTRRYRSPPSRPYTSAAHPRTMSGALSNSCPTLPRLTPPPAAPASSRQLSAEPGTKRPPCPSRLVSAWPSSWKPLPVHDGVAKVSTDGVRPKTCSYEAAGWSRHCGRRNGAWQGHRNRTLILTCRPIRSGIWIEALPHHVLSRPPRMSRHSSCSHVLPL
jgi:hypothetical protein